MKKYKTLDTASDERESNAYLAKNLIKLLNFHEMNESDLAKNLQLPYNTIHRLLTGTTSDPRVSTLQQIADYFGVTLDYLLRNPTSNAFSTTKKTHRLPLLNWSSLLSPHFRTLIESNQHAKWVEVAQSENIKNSKNAFALESTKSMQPRFPAGTRFIVSMEEEVIDGDVVLIRFKDNTVSLRELAIDSPHWQLNPIIPGSSSLIFNAQEHEMVGVVLLTLIQTRV